MKLISRLAALFFFLFFGIRYHDLQQVKHKHPKAGGKPGIRIRGSMAYPPLSPPRVCIVYKNGYSSAFYLLSSVLGSEAKTKEEICYECSAFNGFSSLPSIPPELKSRIKEVCYCTSYSKKRCNERLKQLIQTHKACPCSKKDVSVYEGNMT